MKSASRRSSIVRVRTAPPGAMNRGRCSGVRDGGWLVALTMGILIAQVAVSVAFADPFSLESRPTPNVEVVASITPPYPDPSGIAISKDGRIFLGFPRHADNHTQFALAELKDGKLIAFPRKDYVYLPRSPTPND